MRMYNILRVFRGGWRLEVGELWSHVKNLQAMTDMANSLFI